MTATSDISLPIQFVLQRNQSLSWYGNKVIVTYIAVLTLGIACVFAYLGMWIILPFAGLEIVALTIGLYLCCLRCQDREVITIDDENLFIEFGRAKSKRQWQFARAWLQLELKKPIYSGHPSQLVVRYKGKEIEIGKYLTNKERKSLAHSLSAVLEKPLGQI